MQVSFLSGSLYPVLRS